MCDSKETNTILKDSDFDFLDNRIQNRNLLLEQVNTEYKWVQERSFLSCDLPLDNADYLSESSVTSTTSKISCDSATSSFSVKKNEIPYSQLIFPPESLTSLNLPDPTILPHQEDISAEQHDQEDISAGQQSGMSLDTPRNERTFNRSRKEKKE